MSSEPVQPEVCTIVVRGERFVLARDQISFDLPNYFMAPFARLRIVMGPAITVTLHRDPHLFKIVQTYLAGYRILPPGGRLDARVYVARRVFENIIEDARFSALRTLVGLLAPAVNGAGVQRAISLNDEEGERQRLYVSPTLEARWRSVPGPIAGASLLIRAVARSTRHESAG